MHSKFLLAALWLSIGGTAAAAESVLSYRQSSYEIAQESQAEAFNWSYPVVLPAQWPANRRLNAWLREQAVQALAGCVSRQVADLQSLTDRQLVEALSKDAEFAACEQSQSVVKPQGAFGRYVTFERVTEWKGSTRELHGIEMLTFDLAAGVAIDIATLFKPAALEALNGALAERIANDPKRPDCHGKKFDWTQVSLRAPVKLFVEFPFNPAEWHDCGDGVEMLSGRVVSEQLLRPETLQPARRWVKERR
jgi:hypothetical protein